MPEFQLDHSKTIPSAGQFNKLIEALMALGGKTAGDGCDAYNLPTGVHFIKHPRRPIPAVITGGKNPYSWSNVVWTGPSGGWKTIGGGGSETVGPAYEINGRTKVPAGQHVELHKGYNGDFRFQWLRMGSPPSSGGFPCGPCSLPASDLTLTLSGTVAPPCGGATTSWSASFDLQFVSSPAHWLTGPGCITLTGPSGARNLRVRFIFQCGVSDFSIGILFYTDSGCTACQIRAG